MTIRIYQDRSLTSPSSMELDEAASHHLLRVLRVNIADPVIIFNGLGGEYLGVIQYLNKKTVTVNLSQHVLREAESSLKTWLLQGISRGEKMDYTIQKAVELGVNYVLPVFTERCTVKLDAKRSEKRLQHWQAIAISACEQSGRNRIPQIVMPQPLMNGITQLTTEFRFVLSPSSVEPAAKKINLPPTAQVALLVGPEGGLSEQEIAWAVQQGFLPLQLGPRVLRTETAALAALAALQCANERWF